MSAPTQAELLQLAIRGEMARIHTSIPGTVLSYDHATQRATVQVAVRSKVRGARGGEISNVDVPPIPGVPVCFPSAAGYAITWPLTAGDPGLIVFAERSTDEWKATGNPSNDAQDVRRFDLSDAVFIPGSVSPAQPIGSTGRDAAAMVLLASSLKLGDSTATDFVALASLVLQELNALRAELVLHTHPVAGVTLGAGSVVSAPPTGIGPSSASVAATKVKAK